MIGEVIGNFRIVRQLGKGGMGTVWLAEHKEIKTKVAIKLLLPHICADKAQVQRFFNEAVAVGHIKHSGIAKIFDVGFRESGEAYLVMEFLDGESLAHRIARTRQGLAQIVEVGRQIASVLDATHVEGITHRDLKPENVFVVRDAEMATGERVKVLDFGIAKLGASELTGASMMGTPAYMSPEQWKASAKVDGRADLYSLGCLMFEMACGRPPFIVTSVGEACDLHLHHPPMRLRELAPNMPAMLEELIARLLAKLPEERPTVREIKAAFKLLETMVETPSALVETLGEESWSDVAVRAAMSGSMKTAPPSLKVTSGATTLSAAAGASIGPQPAVTQPPARSRLPWIAAAAIVVVGGGALAAMKLGGGSGGGPAPAPKPDVAVQPVAPPATPPAVPAHTGAHVTIKTMPATAEITLDGVVVTNPYDATFAPSSETHQIRATAPGYKIAARTVQFDADRPIELTLLEDAPVGKPATPVVVRPAVRPTTPVPVAAHPTPAPTVVQTPAPTPTPAVVVAPTHPVAPAGAGSGSGKVIYQGTEGSIIIDLPPPAPR